MRSNESDGPPFGLWNGAPRRWALVGEEELLGSGTPVAGGVGQFRYIDLSRAGSLVAEPVGNSFPIEVDPFGPFHWFGNDGQLLIVGQCPSNVVTIRLESLPDLSPLPVVITDGPTLVAATVNAVGTAVTVPLHTRALLTFGNRRPATVSARDPRVLAVRIRSLGCAPVSGSSTTARPGPGGRAARGALARRASAA
jgi:hypothetical protein